MFQHVVTQSTEVWQVDSALMQKVEKESLGRDPMVQLISSTTTQFCFLTGTGTCVLGFQACIVRLMGRFEVLGKMKLAAEIGLTTLSL